MRRILASIFLLAVACFAGAWIRGMPSGPLGVSQLNINTLQPAQVINIWKAGIFEFANPADAALLDDTGYLVGTPSGAVSVYKYQSPNNIWSGVSYRARWGAGVTSQVSITSFITGCAATGTASFTGCTGSGTTTINNTGGVGTVTFTLPSGGFTASMPSGFTYAHTGGEFAIYRVSDETDYLAGKYWTPEYISFLRSERSGSVRTMGLINIGNTGNFNGESTWLNRIKPTDQVWNVFKIPPRIWGGTISGTDTYTGAAAPSTPASPTDGTQYIGIVTNANVSGAVTLNIGTWGAIPVVNKDGSTALGTGCAAGSNACIRAGTIATFTYDALLNKFMFVGGGGFSDGTGGVEAGLPLEAQIQLGNLINANIWPTIPAWATDDYVTNWASLECSTVSSGLFPYFEYGNEIWNSSFNATSWASARGQALGWGTSSNVATYGWYGLRTRQIMGNLIPSISSCANRTIRRVLAYQAAGDTTNRTYRFEGSQLCPGCSGANATYNSWTGSANYSTVGQRPIDVVEVLAYAPYAGGGNLCYGVDSPLSICTALSTAVHAPALQCLINAVEGGSTAGCAATNPSVASPTPVNLVDDDMRQGRAGVQTVTCSGTTCTTPLAHGFTANSTNISFQVTGGTSYSGLIDKQLYQVLTTPTSTTFTMQAYVGGKPGGGAINAGSAGSGTVTVGISNAGMIWAANAWEGFGEANAALYDAQRGSLAPLRVEHYEGNIEPLGPTSAQCLTLGLTTVPPDGTGALCASEIQSAIQAWLTDNKANLTQQAYFNWFMGTDSSFPPSYQTWTHSKAPSQLISLYPSCTANSVPSTSLPWMPLTLGCLPNSGLSQVGLGYQAFNN